MSDLTPELAAEVVAACQAGAEEAAGALGRCFDGEFTFSVGEAGTFADDATGPDDTQLDGPGLLILLKFGDVGMVALLPESSGMLPEWYASPDPTGESKLSTLAQELSMLLVPETLMADVFEAKRVEHLQEAARRGQIAEDACLVPLSLQSGEHTGQLSLVWPLAGADAVFPAQEEESAGDEAQQEAAPAAEGASPVGAQPSKIHDFSQLPSYARSLLRIQIPVSVKLASKKESIQEIVDLVPGAILKFDKACDQQLHLLVGNQQVAEGEAVKVGDKFGFRVGAMLMPEESFLKVRK